MTNEQKQNVMERITRTIRYFDEMWTRYCLHPRKYKACRDIANEYDGQIQGLIIALLMLGVNADEIKKYIDERVEDKKSVGYIHFKSVLETYSTKF